MKHTRIASTRLEDGRLLLLNKFGHNYQVQAIDPNTGHIDRIQETRSHYEAICSYQDTINDDHLID